ncbi:glycosyltransferase [Paracoccus suum]|nr:glycosyltransferase [Paracoccus suum]
MSRHPLRMLRRTAQVLAAEGVAGLADRMRQLGPLPPAPEPARMLAAARRQTAERPAVLFQPWHIAQYRDRQDGPPPDWRRVRNMAEWDSVDPVTLRAMDGRRMWPAGAESAATPRVSIVTRTMGTRPELLAQAIASVLNQTAAGIEHIIVQDGGDSMAPLCGRVQREYDTVLRFLALPRSGRSAAANAGVEATNAPLVMFLDDDDLLLPHHVATLAPALDAASDAPAAYSLAWEVPTDIAADGTATEIAYIRHPHQVLPFSHRRLARMNFLPIQSVLFRSTAYAACGGMDPALDLLEDWDLWRRMAGQGDFVRVPRATSIYRVPADPTAAARRRAALVDTQRSMTGGGE